VGAFGNARPGVASTARPSDGPGITPTSPVPSATLAAPSPTRLAEASGLLGMYKTTLAPKDIDPGGVGHHTLTVHGCELLVELGGALNSSAKAASRRPSPIGCGSM